jgi:hypothetical protein
MDGRLVLKERLESSKFGIVYPEGVELHAYVDNQNRVFAEHPQQKNTYIRVSRKNIRSSKNLRFRKFKTEKI